MGLHQRYDIHVLCAEGMARHLRDKLPITLITDLFNSLGAGGAVFELPLLLPALQKRRSVPQTLGLSMKPGLLPGSVLYSKFRKGS